MYVTAHSLPAPIPLEDRFTTHWPRIPVSLKCHGGGSSLSVGVIDPFGKEFGSLDTNSARVLVPLLERNLVRLQTIVLPRKKQPGHLPGPETDGKCKTPLEMQANVYGPVMNMGAIAKILADKNGRLKRPSQTDGLEYVPPMGTPGVSRVLPVQVDTEAAVFTMLEELQKQVENLPNAEADPRITTPLLKHQKQGLHFMMSKERDRDYTDSKGNTSLWRTFGHGSPTFYENVITCDQREEKPDEVYGGILADVMGLGKTLQVICLIVGSLDAATAFAAPAEGERPSKRRRVKTTLVVSPLSTIGNWEGQIKAHVKFGTLSVYVYHGPKRVLSIEKLAQYDVILTTYQIVGGEFAKHTTGGGGASASKGSCPFQKLHFFRIVLDEAHMIRSPSIMLTRAMLSLNAQRRWAVTGTPIQNRLGDIATLVKFLRIAPFDDSTAWNKYIAAPFKNANIESIANLRRILHSVTLRRSKGIINLPPRKDEVVFLDFSSSEQQLYEATLRMSRRKLDLVLRDGHIGGQNYVHVLQSILRLRLICAHGSELVGDSDTAGITSSHAINVDEIGGNASDLPWSVKDGYQIFRLMYDANDDICALCEAKVGINSTAGSVGDEDSPSNKKVVVIGHLTACAHLLCKTCGPRFTEEFNNASISAAGNKPLHGDCPLCGACVSSALLDIKSDYNEDSVQDLQRRKKLKGRYGGPSTKVKALISSLLENKKASTTSSPIKSVVFSCWTSHMDLIEIAFKDNGINFVRLDGSMTRTQRNRVMEDFERAPEISVILISIMAGGLGLNLTAACKAYVMEPQFNPAAESQAIDRIHRLGQTRPVTTTRYIMRDSFEMKIVELQKKKTELANLSMSSGRLSGKDAMAKKLEDLKTLFR
ncbi:unnamed protein product [Tuber melanosporum]|uniref:(Perigord truffle) hypothetical protein n=1 Tax=Tuber melanosporum (strain Mel28) TaxID=656061 RepID=D5G6P5_TUBMM|nr:uncharacterized protein GSTUM_00002154001 [Tuber melanosporum]CAZ80188.1 unnamed protein product [Tuber melanosporum]